MLPINAAFLVLDIVTSLGHCHVIIPNKEILFFWSLSRDFSNVEAMFVYGILVKKQCYFAFHIRLFRKQLSNKIAAQFLCNFSKNLSYGKHNVKDNRIAHHDDKLCFLPTCRYHIFLIGDIEELLQQLHVFRFEYQHVHSAFDFFMYRLSEKFVTKSEKLFVDVQRVVFLIKETEKWT